MAKAIADNPDATQQQIADQVGVTQQRVSQLTNEIQAKSEPKLLKHGGNMAKQGDYRHVDRGSNNADYILARLKRDGHGELAEQVKAGTLSLSRMTASAAWAKLFCTKQKPPKPCRWFDAAPSRP